MATVRHGSGGGAAAAAAPAAPRRAGLARAAAALALAAAATLAAAAAVLLTLGRGDGGGGGGGSLVGAWLAAVVRGGGARRGAARGGCAAPAAAARVANASAYTFDDARAAAVRTPPHFVIWRRYNESCTCCVRAADGAVVAATAETVRATRNITTVASDVFLTGNGCVVAVANVPVPDWLRDDRWVDYAAITVAVPALAYVGPWPERWIYDNPENSAVFKLCSPALAGAAAVDVELRYAGHAVQLHVTRADTAAALASGGAACEADSAGAGGGEGVGTRTPRTASVEAAASKQGGGAARAVRNTSIVPSEALAAGAPRSLPLPPPRGRPGDGVAGVSVGMCVMAFLDTALGPAWFDYWHHLGVDRFYLYLNHDLDALDDEARARLVALLAHVHRVVTVIEWPYKHTEHNLPGVRLHYGQMMAFQSCLHRYRRLHTHLAFFDVDEFAVLERDASLQHFVARGGVGNASMPFDSLRLGHYYAGVQTPDGRGFRSTAPGGVVTRDFLLAPRVARHREYDAPWDRKKMIVATASRVQIVGNHWLAEETRLTGGAVEGVANASEAYFLHWANLARHDSMQSGGGLYLSYGAAADVEPTAFLRALAAARDANDYYAAAGGDGAAD